MREVFPWTPEQVDTLKVLWGRQDLVIRDIAQVLGTTVRSARSKAEGIGLGPRVKGFSWTPEQIARLREAISDFQGYEAVAEHVGDGCTYEQARSKARALKIAPKQNPRQAFNVGLPKGPTFKHEGDAWKPLPGSQPLTLAEKAANGCMWPVGGSGEATLFCCERKLPIASYCQHHWRWSRSAA